MQAVGGYDRGHGAGGPQEPARLCRGQAAAAQVCVWEEWFSLIEEGSFVMEGCYVSLTAALHLCMRLSLSRHQAVFPAELSRI